MNLRALLSTSSKLAAALATAATAVILGSCGGGGSGASFTGGPLLLQPSTGTFFAGVPYTFTVSGGVMPYLVSSNQPDLFPLPPTELSGHTFTVIPNNPAVVDSGLDDDALQGRTVIIQVRDKNGALLTSNTSNGIFVARNFFTGYGVFYTSSCAAPAGGGGAAAAAPPACVGGDTIVQVLPVTNGGLWGNRQFRLEVITGQFGWVTCDTTAPVQGTQTIVPTNTITCTTDHMGKANVRMRVSTTAGAQIASFRVVDVASGVSATHLIQISASAPGALRVIPPDDITMTGPAGTTRCGTGPATVLVFDGTEPYTAISSSPIFNAQVNGNQVVINGSGQCGEGAIIIQDSGGRVATVNVEAVASGTAPPALQISPTTLDLNNTCGLSASALYIPASAVLNYISTHPRVSVISSGGIITITRAASGDGATVFPNTATITVTDGTTLTTITANNVATNCP